MAEALRLKIHEALRKAKAPNTADWIMDGIEEGLYFVHERGDEVLVLEKDYDGSEPYLRVVAFHGSLEGVHEYWLEYLSEAATQNGCGYILFSGRLGWERALGSRGWRAVGTVMRKEV